jgi:hypothetical protein
MITSLLTKEIYFYYPFLTKLSKSSLVSTKVPILSKGKPWKWKTKAQALKNKVRSFDRLKIILSKMSKGLFLGQIT